MPERAPVKDVPSIHAEDKAEGVVEIPHESVAEAVSERTREGVNFFEEALSLFEEAIARQVARTDALERTIRGIEGVVASAKDGEDEAQSPRQWTGRRSRGNHESWQRNVGEEGGLSDEAKDTKVAREEGSRSDEEEQVRDIDEQDGSKEVDPRGHVGLNMESEGKERQREEKEDQGLIEGTEVAGALRQEAVAECVENEDSTTEEDERKERLGGKGGREGEEVEDQCSEAGGRGKEGLQGHSEDASTEEETDRDGDGQVEQSRSEDGAAGEAAIEEAQDKSPQEAGSLLPSEWGIATSFRQSLRDALASDCTWRSPAAGVAKARGGWECTVACLACSRPLNLDVNLQAEDADLRLSTVLCRACLVACKADPFHSERVRVEVLRWTADGCPIDGRRRPRGAGGRAKN